MSALSIAARRPAFERVETYDPDRIVVLAREKVLNDSLKFVVS